MNMNLNRRQFMELPALVGIVPGGLAEAAEAGVSFGLITRLALVDDCTRLAMHQPGLPAAFCDSLVTHRDIARLSGIPAAGAKDLVELLASCRDAWPHRKPAARLPQKLAFVLGALLHRAAERELASPAADQERRLYQDAAVLREFSGVEPPSATQAQLEDLFRVISRRFMIELHTFSPDTEDVNGWVERLVGWSRQDGTLCRALAQACAAPDAGKLRQHITAPDFYDRNDPLIRLARSVQAGRLIGRAALRAALEAPGAHSQYGRALRLGCSCLEAAGACFQGRLEETALLQRLER